LRNDWYPSAVTSKELKQEDIIHDIVLPRQEELYRQKNTIHYSVAAKPDGWQGRT
jgi:hypothetical protein